MKKVNSIAIVDDDEIYIFLTQKTIEKTGLVNVINKFDNGLDVLNFLKENKDNINLLPEIIFLDLSMPIMDGWQFLEQYILLYPKLEKQILIYVCSSSISPNDINKVKSFSIVSDFIIKPLTEEKIIDIIKKM